MEPWPIRSRGFMSGVLQGSWSIGFLLSSVIYGLFYDVIGWRGMLWIGVLPALSIVYIRYFVKEPPVWIENRRRQLAENRQVRAPLIKIFQRGMIANTLLACWWMASNFVLYYSIWALFATHLQADLHLTTSATPSRCWSAPWWQRSASSSPWRSARRQRARSWWRIWSSPEADLSARREANRAFEQGDLSLAGEVPLLLNAYLASHQSSMRQPL